MNISNIGNINIVSHQLEGLAPTAPVSALPKDGAATKTKNDEVKQAAESTPKKDTGSTDSNLNSDELKHISEKLQRMFNSDLIFSVDEKSGEHVIQVIDKSTKEVIRQIPSAEAIQIKESIDRFQKGLLVNIKT
ncbi:MAG: flagellar protein FlaG [Methylomonas sp.]|uniref:flagellar protein FlaG n=1 Tax=Methylomonas sp. TaxID=418 RepID=UPI0025E10FB2|nr:flagellar protein FlaG [Methylomonas sp.]MCK9605223.1 flagellar protein FlaG [Methylomonas sp.]